MAKKLYPTILINEFLRLQADLVQTDLQSFPILFLSCFHLSLQRLEKVSKKFSLLPILLNGATPGTHAKTGKYAKTVSQKMSLSKLTGTDLVSLVLHFLFQQLTRMSLELQQPSWDGSIPPSTGESQKQGCYITELLDQCQQPPTSRWLFK